MFEWMFFADMMGIQSVVATSEEFSELIASKNLRRASHAASDLTHDDPLISSHRVSKPIKLTKGIDSVYRWDSRPPNIINKHGFSGTGDSRWWNKIFGKRTVYAAKDIDGCIAFLDELKNTFKKVPDKQYLYRVDTRSVSLVDVHASYLENKEKFPYVFAERETGYFLKTEDEQSYTDFLSMRYLKDTVSRNHEVQLMGPIRPNQIEFILSKKLSEIHEI